MKINKIEKKLLTVEINGRIDNESAPILAKEITGFSSEYEKLTLDLQNTEYISSAGLRVILSAQKESLSSGKVFSLANVSKNNMEILDITGFLDILTIE